MSSPSDRRTQAQVFHYWQLYKTSAQYLSMMEGQLVERQRQRRLQGALRAWRGVDEEVLAAEAGLASPTAFRNSLVLQRLPTSQLARWRRGLAATGQCAMFVG